MSATINSGKLKFSVFGNGFEETRNDSGFGTSSKELDIVVYRGAFDISGDYAWLVTSNGLKKYSTSNWTEVSHNLPASNFIIHPDNVSNNYCVAFTTDWSQAYVFDMTDDSIVCTVTSTVADLGGTWDCILVDDKIHMMPASYGNTNLQIITIDLTNATFSKIVVSDMGSTGFINDSMFFGFWQRVWFHQTTMAYGMGIDGSTIWSNTGLDNNSNLEYFGLVGNGKLYFPTYLDGAWHFGVYNGVTNPTLKPPTPERYFGFFDTRPSFVGHLAGNDRNHYVAYTDGRTKACMETTAGVLVTDFTSVEKIREFGSCPIAMNDRYILCTDYNTHKLYVEGY